MSGTADTKAGAVLGTVLGYVRAHWRGEQDLLRAFWLNFVCVTGLAWLIGPLLREPLDERPLVVFGVASGQFLLFWLVVYPWQFIGVLRAGDRAVADFRHGVLGRIAPVVVALSLVGAFPRALELVQSLYFLHNPVETATDQAPPYRLSLTDDGRFIHIDGFLDFGVTRDFRELLESRDGVAGVILDSGGGPVYEGRALGNVIRRAGLDTYSSTGCSSACITAFIGGRTRWLAPGARLGFHQFRLDAVNVHPFIDIAEEQRIELDNYAGQGIERGFLERVFHKPHTDIWFPAVEELLAAGVVHGVLDEEEAARLGTLP